MPTETPARTKADVLADLALMRHQASEQAIPFNLARACELLAEHASLADADPPQAPADVSALTARLDAVELLLTEAGIKPAPAPAPNPGP